MSNLSDLLPAGGGAKVITATADGNLATGQTVALQSNGTVKAIASDATSVSENIGTPVEFDSTSSDFNGIAAAYDVNSGKHVIAFRDSDSSNRGTVVIGTPSGSSISFGTPVVFNSSNSSELDVAYADSLNKFLVHFKDHGNNNKGAVIVGTVSGTSATFGSLAYYADFAENDGRMVWSTDDNVFVVVWDDDNNDGESRVGSVSGTSITYGTEVAFHDPGGSNGVSDIGLGYVSNSKVVVAFRDKDDSNDGKACVGTISGTSISWGSAVDFSTGRVKFCEVCYDPVVERVLITYYDEDNSDYPMIVVGQVSGTSITFGTPVVVNSSGTSNAIEMVYNTAAAKTVLYYNENTNNSNTFSKLVTVSGTTPTLSTAINITSGDNRYYEAALAYNSTDKNVLLAYAGAASPYNGYGLIYTAAYVASNSSDFVGITNQAINDTASGEVVVEGGVITNASLLPFAYTGTTGSAAVFESAASNSFGIAFDSSNNKVVVTYDDEGNSSYGTAVVGTVSGTSLSWGTPVVFNSASVNGSNCFTAFDSNVNKTVTIFRDNGNSEYGTAIVGTVSGTSISFGTKVVYNSASARATSTDICFDSTNNKLLICYEDYGNSRYGTAIVGTVSGTSISFGSEVVFDSTAIEMVGTVHDPSTGKNVVANKRGSDNNGVAQVATISGTSVSFGSQAVFNSTGTYRINAVYDSNANKVVLCYENDGGGSIGQAKVCTISGTSISFGTAATFSEAGDSVNWVTAGFDSSQNRVVVVTAATGQTISRFNSGAVSGTDITFDTPQTFLSGNAYPLGQKVIFDTTQNTNVWVYKDNSNSQYGTGIGMQLAGGNPNLTVGSTYYVQDDGTLSTTSSSVTAGKAIANTTLLLKG